MSSNIDLDFIKGSANNKLAVTLKTSAGAALSFTDVRVRVFSDKGSKFIFTSLLASAEVDATANKVTWTPSAAQSAMLTDINYYTLEALVAGVWKEQAHGIIKASGSSTAIPDAPSAGSGGGGGGGSQVLPAYAAATYYKAPGMVAIPGKVIIPGQDTMVLVPVRLDQNAAITTIGFSCGATVSGGLAHVAVYASDPVTRLPTGLPLAKTTTPATCNTLNNNANAVLDATLNMVAGTTYWIAFIGSTSAVGFLAGYNAAMADVIGGGGMGNMQQAGELIGSFTVPQTYAASMTWLNLTSVARGTDKPNAPLTFLKTA